MMPVIRDPPRCRTPNADKKVGRLTLLPLPIAPSQAAVGRVDLESTTVNEMIDRPTVLLVEKLPVMPNAERRQSGRRKGTVATHRRTLTDAELSHAIASPRVLVGSLP